MKSEPRFRDVRAGSAQADSGIRVSGFWSVHNYPLGIFSSRPTYMPELSAST
jgi:hypothetical protein